MSMSNKNPSENGKFVSVKVSTIMANGDKELRRFSCEPTFAAVHAAIVAAFGASAFTLRYTDDENEQIRMATDAELLEAMRVATVNGVLRINAERAANTDSIAPPAIPAAAAAPAASTNNNINENDVEFWSQLPAWLQEKIVNRTAEHQSAVAHLPLSDVAHFACLPADVQSRLRANAADHAAARRAKLAKKATHHRDAAEHLQAHAEKLLAKAARQREIAEYKNAKLEDCNNKIVPSDDKNNNKKNNNDDDGETPTPPTPATVDDDATVWSRVPAHVKTRLGRRWCPDRCAPADLASPMTFASMPAFVRERVRACQTARLAMKKDGSDDEEEHRERRGRWHGGCRHRGMSGERRGWWRANNNNTTDAATATTEITPPTPGAAAATVPMPANE